MTPTARRIRTAVRALFWVAVLAVLGALFHFTVAAGLLCDAPAPTC